MWIAARAAHAVAVHAQLLAGSAVAARAAHRVEPGSRPVCIGLTWQADPASGVWRLIPRAGHHTRARVARLTRGLRVAGDAEHRIAARFERMPRREAGAVHVGPLRLVKVQARWQRGDGQAVAGRAGALGVAALAEPQLAGRTHPVLTHEVG